MTTLVLRLGKIHTCEIPLGHLDYSEFPELVIDQGVRPDHPEDNEAPQLTDGVWRLAKHCWKNDPLARPSISAVCKIFSQLLDDHHHTPIVLDGKTTIIPEARYHIINVQSESLLDLWASNLTAGECFHK